MPRDSDYLPEDEAASRRDEVVRKMANTAPQPKAKTPHRQGRKRKAVAARAVRKVRASRAS
jgi:hypothetical protein